MLTTRTTQQIRYQEFIHLYSFVGVALFIALYSNSTIAQDCGKTQGGMRLACTFLDDEAIFNVPLDFYKHGIEVTEFEAK